MNSPTTNKGRNASERPSSNPESASVWRRHVGDSKFHVGDDTRDSFVTLCNGRWSQSDEQLGDVERHPDPPADSRCGLCAERLASLDVERTEIHMLVDHLLTTAADVDGEGWTVGVRLAREIKRLRGELEARTNELHIAERELAETQDSPPLEFALSNALVEAIEIARIAGRRGWLSERQRVRLAELARQVPQ